MLHGQEHIKKGLAKQVLSTHGSSSQPCGTRMLPTDTEAIMPDMPAVQSALEWRDAEHFMTATHQTSLNSYSLLLAPIQELPLAPCIK